MSLRDSSGPAPDPNRCKLYRDVRANPLDYFEKPTPLKTLIDAAEEIEAEEREIQLLRDEIATMAQRVRQAYHGAGGVDVDHGTLQTCSRGLCKRAQDVLRPSRRRGQV